MTKETQANTAQLHTPAGPFTLKKYDVLIKRDVYTTIQKNVFAHELPVIQHLHGRANVTVVGESDVEAIGFNVDAEYERLCRLYNSKNTDAVTPIYGIDSSKLSDVLGVSSTGQSVERKQSLIKPRKKATAAVFNED